MKSGVKFEVKDNLVSDKAEKNNPLHNWEIFQLVLQKILPYPL